MGEAYKVGIKNIIHKEKYIEHNDVFINMLAPLAPF